MGYAFQAMVGSNLTYEQPEQGAEMCAGEAKPGMRGKRGTSSWTFHIAGPCDPWCDRLVHCCGVTKH